MKVSIFILIFANTIILNHCGKISDKRIENNHLKIMDNDCGNISSETDSVKNYLINNIDFASFCNLAFTIHELCLLMENDTSFSNKFIKLYKKELNKNMDIEQKFKLKEVAFFKKKALNKIDSMKFPYCNRIFEDIPDLKTEITNYDYINIVNKFNKADGAKPWELSSIYYSLLISDGVSFISKIKNNKNSLGAYLNWIENIELYEFQAYTSDNLPPQIIIRKKEYVLNQLKNDSTDPMVIKTYNKIDSAKIEYID